MGFLKKLLGKEDNPVTHNHQPQGKLNESFAIHAYRIKQGKETSKSKKLRAELRKKKK
jgi:hypothetical protein